MNSSTSMDKPEGKYVLNLTSCVDSHGKCRCTTAYDTSNTLTLSTPYYRVASWTGSVCNFWSYWNPLGTNTGRNDDDFCIQIGDSTQAVLGEVQHYQAIDSGCTVTVKENLGYY